MNILDVSHYYTYPPMSGGQIRIFNLNKNIAKKHILIQISFTPAFVKPKTLSLGKYSEIILPKALYMGSAFFISRILRMPFDFIVPFVFKFVKEKRLENLIKGADIIQVEHPWIFSFIYKKAKRYNKKIILVEHNVEYMLQFDSFKIPINLKKILVKYIKKVEEFAVKNANIVLTTSENDKNILVKSFNLNKSKILVVKNGIDFKLFNEKKNLAKLQKLKNNIKKNYKGVILFSGSRHPPNYEAMKIIENKLSKKLSDYLFLIAGSLHKKDKKRNIIYTGPVRNIIPYFHISDVAINPVVKGSGTNLKMLEYSASGLPVVTTKIGARGLDLENNKDCIISELKDFEANIRNVFSDDIFRKKLIKNGKKAAKQHDWNIVSKELMRIYNHNT
jgi:glycosyltransferase involved in cell wall biosynthesis